MNLLKIITLTSSNNLGESLPNNFLKVFGGAMSKEQITSLFKGISTYLFIVDHAGHLQLLQHFQTESKLQGKLNGQTLTSLHKFYYHVIILTEDAVEEIQEEPLNGFTKTT